MKVNIQKILYGVATGDALGVPVEFESREDLKQNPVTDMQEYGTYDEPKGTWSDDTSLTLCLAESIVEGLDLQLLTNKFIAWKNDNYWTANGWVFDIGIGTRIAIENLETGIDPELAGGNSENDNGNGSLMRILPLILHSKNLPMDERFEITKKVSSLTHRHIRSVIACFYYLEFAKQIIEGIDKYQIYKNLQGSITDFLENNQIDSNEIEKYSRLLNQNIFEFPENQIYSSGYVVHSLETSIWCFLSTENYKDAVLKAINLGDDTDTNGAITGGLAALYYGVDEIPKEWLAVIARKNDIDELIQKFNF